MPIVEVTLLDGRTPAKKVALMRRITDVVVETIDAPRDSVRVILREIPAEHFAAGGEPKKMPEGVE